MEPLSTDVDTSPLDLTLGPRLGEVVRVDPSRIEVELSDPGMSSRVTVSDLVALPAGVETVIGLAETVQSQPPGRTDDPPVETEGSHSRARLRIMPVGTLHSPDSPAGAGFTRGVSAYPRLGESCFLIDGDRLRRFMSVVAEEVAPGERLIIGRYVADREAIAIADGNRLFQRHAALLGSTGAGKSWAVAMMLERASRLGHANLVVFDLHGEYSPLVQATNGAEPVARGLRIAGPMDVDVESEDLLYIPYWLLERDELLSLVLNPEDPHASDQVLRLTEHIQTLRGVYLLDEGKEDAIYTFTGDSPIPYVLEHLVAKLRQDNEEKIPRPPSERLDPGLYYQRMTGLITRIEARMTDPRYRFIFAPPPSTLGYGWLADTASRLLSAGEAGEGIKVVDLSEVPSAVLPIIVGVLARLVFDVQFWMEPEARTPVCLVCDEAHVYLPADEHVSPVHAASLRAFESIAKEGRKYGVALVVVSQRPTDVSRTILSQCNNFIVMRLTNDNDQTVVERLLPETLSGTTGMLPALEVGEAMVIGDALLLPTRVKFDPPQAQPTGATQPYWSLWSTQPSSQASIAAGVDAYRSQLRARTEHPEPGPSVSSGHVSA